MLFEYKYLANIHFRSTGRGRGGSQANSPGSRGLLGLEAYFALLLEGARLVLGVRGRVLVLDVVGVWRGRQRPLIVTVGLVRAWVITRFFKRKL